MNVLGLAIRRLGCAAPAVLLLAILTGCGLADAPIVSPKGPIALEERNLLYTAFGLMMIVTVPVFILTFWFCWRYRASRPRGAYTPEWGGSWRFEAVIWTVPAVIVIVLGVMLWTTTHRLDPYKALGDGNDAFEVQAIAQDWKWLFIYPELGTATVNELAFPADRPLRLKITSDTVMNSFMIPALGGQIYAMAGMKTQLNLIASEPGVFKGRNTMYSGDGYATQYFNAHALSDTDFAAWSQKVKDADKNLDARTYVELVMPSVSNPVTYYSSYEPGLFNIVLLKYNPRPGPYTEAAAIICGVAA
ncbi:MAG: ubiquinol oxidase subunit II [Pseudomonadota bacterium]